jgi:SAM-dependent methyltransferase
MRFARYDRIAAHYPAMWPLLAPGYVPTLEAMLEIVKVRDTRPRRLLDVGCGPGSATVAVAPACDGEARVTLVDGSAAMIAAARTVLGPGVESAIVGDFNEESVARQCFEPEGFDLVLSSFALHHLADADKRTTIERMGVALRPGGMLLLADEVAADRPGGWEMVERVRGRTIERNLVEGRLSPEFWELETSLAEEDRLPFLPARVDELTSFMARASLATACPLVFFGAALLVGLKNN